MPFGEQAEFGPMDADAVEIRVLGSLIEKQRTTPEAYPLSLNALRLACNQSTNRNPVVEYSEPEIRAALERMSNRGWARLASGPGSRAVKYRHLLDQALDLAKDELVLLAVLMLRGPQTLGELKQRSERLHAFGSGEQVAETLDRLAARELVVRLPRRPGQKEDRFAQLLGGAEEPDAAPRSPAPATDDDSRLAEIEARLERLERNFDELLTRTDRLPADE